MTVSNYTDLQTEILGYIDRSDSTTIAAVPGWIQLTEAKINRKVKTQEQEQLSYIDYDSTFTEPFVSIPSGFVEFYSLKIRPLTAEDYEYTALEFVDPSKIDIYYDKPGEPTHYTLRDQLELNCLPSVDYRLRMHYLKKWNLATDLTNWLLTNYPDVYVYGALAHGSMWLKDVDKEQRNTWIKGFAEAVEELDEIAYRNRPQGVLTTDDWDLSRYDRDDSFDILRGSF